MKFNDERGSALVTVLIMVTALIIMSGALLKAFSLHYSSARRDLNRIQAFYFAEAGIYQALSRLSGNDGYDWNWRPQKEQISVANNQTVEISITERGGFLIITSSVQYHHQHKQLQVQVGQNIPNAFNQAIILGGTDYPLVVTGNNRIIGNVTVGTSGVKPGSIKGSKFIGQKVVEGTINRVSPPKLPQFDAALFIRNISTYRQLLKSSLKRVPDNFSKYDSLGNTSKNRILIVQGEIDSSVVSDSLLTGPLTIISDGNLLLSGFIKFGNPVNIVARGKVEITDSVFLDDVVVYSDTTIVVSGNVRGAMQLITQGDILVSGQAQLEYPSVLFTSGHVVANRLVGSITIAENANVTGSVILNEYIAKEENNIRRQSKVEIAEKAQVTGLIFSTNHTTISGQVNGIVIADHFYLYASPTTYINWLKDAYINRRNLAAGFKLPLMFTENPSLEVVAWVKR